RQCRTGFIEQRGGSFVVAVRPVKQGFEKDNLTGISGFGNMKGELDRPCFLQSFPRLCETLLTDKGPGELPEAVNQRGVTLARRPRARDGHRTLVRVSGAARLTALFECEPEVV